jgi:hypothetical protein
MTPAGKAIAVFTTNELNVRIAEDIRARHGHHLAAIKNWHQ